MASFHEMKAKFSPMRNFAEYRKLVQDPDADPTPATRMDFLNISFLFLFDIFLVNLYFMYFIVY